MKDVFFSDSIKTTFENTEEMKQNIFLFCNDEWWKEELKFWFENEGEEGEREKPVLFLFQSSFPYTLRHLNKRRAVLRDDSVTGVVN